MLNSFIISIIQNIDNCICTLFSFDIRIAIGTIVKSIIAHSIGTESNTIFSSRSTVQNRIFNKVTERISIRDGNTTDKDFNHITANSIKLSLKRAKSTSITTLRSCTIILSLNKIHDAIISITQNRFFIFIKYNIAIRILLVHKSRINDSSTRFICFYFSCTSKEIITYII